MKNLYLTVVGCALLLACACTSYEYDGEELAPLEDNVNVKIYTAEEQVPVSCHKLGTLRFSTRPGTMPNEIHQKLKDQARKRGATVVLIRRLDTTVAGTARADQLRNQDAPAWDRGDNFESTRQSMVNTMEYKRSDEAEKEIYKASVEAELFESH